MAGYERRRLLLRLDLEAESLAGLSIIYQAPTVAAFNAALDVPDYSPVESITVQDVRALRVASEQFAGLIESWNLEQGGVPVPVAAFLSLEALFVLQVTNAWVRVACGWPQVPAPPAPPSEEFDETQLPVQRLEEVQL